MIQNYEQDILYKSLLKFYNTNNNSILLKLFISFFTNKLVCYKILRKMILYIIYIIQEVIH